MSGALRPGAAAALALVLLAAPAQAQIRGFADVGGTTFAAKESFRTVLGTNSGVVLGGGVQVDLPYNVFVALRASQFRRSGQRVFVFEEQTFNLGVDTSVTVAPIQLSAGYRFPVRRRVVAYGGGGIGWHRYTETSTFATDAENVSESFTGYQLLGGAEFRLHRWIAAAGEAEWATVPDALSSDPNSVSAAFDEHDLGGVTFRVKVAIGR